MSESPKRFGVTANVLKLIAIVSMTLDHIGLELLTQYPIFRILGRLAMPIFAYMIAEGCRHTGDRRRYLMRLGLYALICQIGYTLATRDLYQSILVTFFLSAVLIFSLDATIRNHRSPAGLLGVVGVWIVCQIFPLIIPGFALDYGIFGVLLPVLVYFGRNRKEQLWGFCLGLVLLSKYYGGVQWYCLGAIPLMLLYNGKRGKKGFGRFFYLYYPAHLVIITGLAQLLS